MRRFLLSAVALMMTISMMAVGLNNGMSKTDAIDFRWGEGHDHQAGATRWYRVDLDSISGLADPTLALYLTNLSDQASKVTVDVSATISVTTPFFSYSVDTAVVNDESYTIAARDYKLLSQNVKMLLEMNVRYLYLELHSEQTIKLSAKKYETSDILDDACTKAKDFDWNGVNVPVGETWYRLNLAEVRSLNKELDFVVANTAATQAQVKFELSLDCPASTIWGYNWSVPAGGEMTEAFGRVFIDELKEDYVYLKLTTDRALELRVEEKVAPAPKDETWTVDDVLTVGKPYTISGEHIFEVPMATLSAPRGMKAEFVIANNTSTNAVLTKQISFANPVKTTIDKELTIEAGAMVVKEVVNNMSGVINSQTAYIRFNATEELTVQLNYVVENEEVMNAKPVEIATCEKSQLLDWNSTITQSGLETKWYEIDLATIKQNDDHLQLNFTNKSNNIVVVMGEIMRACEGETISYICPIPAGQTISQVINYNLFALVPHPEHFYISATVIPTTATSIMELKDIRSQADVMKFVPKDLDAIQAAKVELTAKTISALVDPADCSQATTINKGVKYEQAAGTTKWYRVTDELLDQLSLIPDLAFINNGKHAANVTIAASVDCAHSTFGMSTITLPTWADMTVFPTRLIGNMLDKALNQDVKEMYLQVTTDQPIAFGIDIDYGFGLGCDDAREFNWETGATINAGDAQWLSFDIASVKANKQQVRLTLTNESNSLAWVAMLTSLTCPFDVALPMVFAIPAGMSVDKVVDYSYFASTKLDQLYIALITEETISLKAVAEKSQASAGDYAACADAVEVKNGEAYTHTPGTKWYKFDRSLFSDVSRLPKFRYAAEATTSLTMGATVGCEYNIATHGTIKLPSTKGLEVSFRMPGFIYDVLNKFVHDDVDAVYVEMTTDQQFKFGIDMEYAGGCEKATKLDLSQPLDIDLTANKDVWYSVNLNDIRALGDKKIAFNLNNPSDKAVEVEFEVTPTCPLIVSAIKSVDVPAGVNLPLVFPASAITNLYDQVVAKFNIPDKIANNLPEQLKDDFVYFVRIRANGDLSIEEGDSIPEHVEPGCDSATPLDITQAIDVEKLAKGWYVVDLTTIHSDFSLKFINNTGANQTLDFQFYKGCDLDEAKMLDNYLTSYNFVIPTTGLEQKVPYSMISSYLTLDELYIYVNKEEGGEVDMACATAVLLDFANPLHIELNDGVEQWFKIAPNDYKNFEKNLVITTQNLAGKSVKVDFSLATSCPALVTVDSTVTINSDHNRVDSITAGMINMAWDQYGDKFNGIDTAYIRVLANGHLVLDVDTFTVVTPEVPDGCENAKDLDFSKTIKLSELTTGWYRVDLTPLKNGQISKISVNNDLGEETGVKFDIFRNCENSSFLYTYTHAFNVGLFEQSIPASALSMLGSLNELYVYITIGVDILTCEDAIEFDWNKGAVHQAGSTQWYHFDIDPVKNNAQQVKLTFTNHSSELAVMYGEVALHCPHTYSIPYACVVPAGMSVDKVIDYSVFAASRVEELYVKVYSNETIELAASSESALVFDNTPCDNAPTIQSGVQYTHQAGTSWYRLPKSLFKNTGMLPKFYFTTEEEGLTKITLGATVGCEYNIATKTIFVLPGSMNYAMVVYEKIFDAIDKLVNDDVTEVYVELTTDKAVHFSVDMINNTDDPCHGAELFDINKGINLEANVDKWYKVDSDVLKALKDDVALTIINPSAEPVDVDMEFSLTCPVVVSLNKSLTIPSGSEMTKVFHTSALSKIPGASILAKIPGISFYVRLKASADLTVKIEEPIVPEDPTECEAAAELDWTKTINLSDLKEGWYKLNLTEVQASKQDVTLTFNNDSNIVVQLGADIYENCNEAMLAGMTYNLPIGLTTKTLDYPTIYGLVGDATELYIYFTIIGEVVPQEACLEAVDYLVGNTIELQPNMEAWYKMDITDAKKKAEDLIFTAHNISNDTVKVTLEMAYECPVTSYELQIKDKVILPLATVTQRLDADYFVDLDVDTVYLHVIATGALTVTVTPDTVTPEIQYDTITTFYCVDELPAILMKNDTVHVSDTLDMVYTYVAKPLVAPIAMTQAILDTIAGATPVLTPGTTPDMTASAEAIKAFYLAQDTKELADVVKVEWTATAIACGATTHTMTLTIEDACGDVQTADFTFNVTTPTLVVTNHNVTICASELPYTLNGITYPSEGTFTTIIPNIYGCDSAQVNMTINLYPAIPETKVVEQICANALPYVWNGKTYNASAKDTVVLVSNINGCDSVVTLDLTVLPAIETYDTVTVCYGQTYYWAEAGMTCKREGAYQATLTSVHGCDSVANLTVKWLPKVVKETATIETICYDQIPFVWRGNSYDATGVYNDTTLNYLGCDSIIHTLDLTVLPAAVTEPTQYVTINEGETYTWPVNNQDYTAQGTYTHIVPNILGCDSIIYTLDLTVIPTHYTHSKTIAEFVCDGTEYIDPITGIKHIISSLIPATQTWSDTVVVSATLDSIYTYQITPIVAPEVMTDATLASIAVAPVLTQGVLPDMSGTVAAIMAYYNGNDTEAIADVNNIYWTDASLNTVVPCGATTHTMTLVVEAGCDNKITTTHTFDVLPVIGTTETVVECDSYTWNGQNYTTSGTYTFYGTTVAGCDSIATLHLTINKSVQVEETIVACDSYTWNGQTYTASGDYTYAGQTAAGCDSIATLHLTINKSFYKEETADACDSYTWAVNGQTYTTSGDYTFAGQTAAGCDSTHVLHLTINKSFYKEETATACDTYTWAVNGQTYTTSGDYTFTGQTAAGCDSTYVLHLTINKSFYKEETAVACDSYTWAVNGQTYQTSGDYTFAGQTAAGCDSTYVLHLTINKSFYKEEIQEACDSYDWNGMTLTASGTYTFNDTTVAGCDSIVTLRLTINKSFYKEVSATACDSYTWAVDGKTYTTSGDYTFAGKTAAGCDSTYVLHLTINKSFYKEETVAACDTYTWAVDGKTYTTSGDYTFTGQTAAGCDSTYVLHLTINKSFYKEETVAACDSYTWAADGKTYTTSGDYTFAGQTAAGCDSTHVLHLTINQSFYKEETAAACVSYTWAVDGKTYTTSGDYTFNGTTAAGCDSTYVLHLTILPDVVYEPTETDYFCPGSTYDWRGYTFNAPGTYNHTIQNALGCDSIIYTLELLQYVNTLPAITADDILAVCGNAVDVTKANAVIMDHVNSEALYAPNADVKWYILDGNQYTELTNTAIDGTITEVTLKYTVTTDCGVVESDPITVQVEQPTPENDVDMIDVPAYSQYGDRLLIIDLKYIENTFGWTVAQEDVTWYYVVDQMDDYADPAAVKNDIVLGHGYYYNEATGNPVKPGTYYARIAHTATSASDCAGVIQTVVLTCATTNLAPALIPTVAQPEELIRIINLDPAQVTTITFFSSTGERLGAYQVTNSDESTFNAAPQAGFYLVEVMTEAGKVSLRYIVK